MFPVTMRGNQPPDQSGFRGRDLLVVLPMLAIACGSAENLALLARKALVGKWVGEGPEMLWMAPAAVLLILIAAASVWWMLSSMLRLHPSRRLRLLLVILGGIGFLGVGLVFMETVHPAAVVVLALGLAVRVSSAAGPRWPLLVRACRITLGPALGVVIVLGLSLPLQRVLRERSAAQALGPAPLGAPNVLFLVWDTARSMSMSAFGYARPTTPALERAARLGVRFTRAVAPSSWTLPSHATFMTGLPPHQTGTDWWKPLGSSAATLSERFRSLGYRTGGFAGNPIFTTIESGLDRGFDRYRDLPVSWGQLLRAACLIRVASERSLIRRATTFQRLGRKSASDVNDEFLQWLEQGRDRPFFAFLNYFDPHDPFKAPSAYWDRFVPERPSQTWIERAWNRGRPLQGGLRFQHDMEARRGSYDAALAATDAQFGALLQALGERKILDSTIIVIVSDHGEEFKEHGFLGHAGSLYWPALWVPLVIVAPGRVPEGHSIDRVADLANLAATILEVAGHPDANWPGRSLSRVWADPAAPGDTALSWLSPAPRNKRIKTLAWSLVADSLHYIKHWDEPAELYNVATDPLELTDLAALPQYAEVRDHLEARLRALRAQ